MLGQDRARPRLDDLSRALLRLHKALLDDERVSYEGVYGRIATNGEFLQLVLDHAWFAWLRPLYQLMAQLDELEVEDRSPSVEITAFMADHAGRRGNWIREALLRCSSTVA